MATGRVDALRPRIEEMRAEGHGWAAISRAVNISPNTIRHAWERWHRDPAPEGPRPWWWDEDKLRAALREHGSCTAISRACGGTPSVPGLNAACARFGIRLVQRKGRSYFEDDGDLPPQPPAAPVPPEDELTERVRGLLGRPGQKAWTLEGLSDEADVSPRRLRGVLDDLRAQGYRIPDEGDSGGSIRLEPVPPAKSNLHRSLLEGDEITVGVVSDTHLCSKEEALDALELIYDRFVERGITEVWHAGDLVAGVGIYRGQVNDLLVHTFNGQVDYAIQGYPRRPGMTTRVIGGNHDLEGEFGRLGADPVAAVCHQRDDLDYLGPWSAHIELPNGAFAQLVHGRGGGGYAVSYKPQRYVEGLAAGRKPALIVFGHWHISGFFRHRNVSLLLGGCFEYQTSLLVRLGLQPDVGGWILTMLLADDGSMVGIVPEWIPVYEGRRAVAA